MAVVGIDVNAANNDGTTALMMAAEGGHAATVAALAGVHGLNPYVVTSADVEVGYGEARVTVPSGSSAMDFARLTHHDAAAEALKPLFSKPVKSAATASRKRASDAAGGGRGGDGSGANIHTGAPAAAAAGDAAAGSARGAKSLKAADGSAAATDANPEVES